jgi:hypothetical protein
LLRRHNAHTKQSTNFLVLRENSSGIGGKGDGGVSGVGDDCSKGDGGGICRGKEAGAMANLNS